MLNTDDFIKRLELILDYYNLSASTFSEKISVQRSSLSHLLSGRNKPSLDFILKIVEVFPEVDLYWLLFNKGEFPKSAITSATMPTPVAITPPTLFENPLVEDNPKPLLPLPSNSDPEPVFNTEENTEKIPNTIVPINTNNTIEKIVIFYKDGTFKDYDKK